ncbi:hypothetical protein FYJ24_11090 [Actinomycetaceae bacterium WB03_NA08]|uniref:Uncharacterized protein n=1 Tax=Scrofimicrobium canadense TaxID=2652290 RepID=A0A6N7VU41_9ACTO|nr:hypothetical protein [Scrofimicrobium canadense]MSS85289.1 hypothetical protein [Scrofimicrobium canadense]
MNQKKKVSIHDRNRGYQALNLVDTGLADVVRPWFTGYEGPAARRIETAINALDRPAQRDRAADFLGLEIKPAA